MGLQSRLIHPALVWVTYSYEAARQQTAEQIDSFSHIRTSYSYDPAGKLLVGTLENAALQFVYKEPNLHRVNWILALTDDLASRRKSMIQLSDDTDIATNA